MTVKPELHLHHTANLELHGALLRDFDPFKRFWILSGTSLAELALKHAEVSELQAVTSAKLLNNVIQEELNYPFDDDSLIAGAVGDSVDEVFFGDGSHDGITLATEPESVWRQ